MTAVQHVFVESNWVYEWIAPEHLRDPTAIDLFVRASSGALRLYVPAICLREGADTLRHRVQTVPNFKAHRPLREFRLWLHAKTQQLSREEGEVIARFLQLYEQCVDRARDEVDARLSQLETSPHVEVFALSDEMLEKAIQLRSEIRDVSLKPFDEAILAAILTKARQLQEDGITPIYFCTKDNDLSPSKGAEVRSQAIRKLYEDVGLTISNAFAIPSL